MNTILMKSIKEYLSGNDYDWSLGNQVHRMKEITPTRNRFDRFNGNCVLHMLNLFDKLVVSVSIQEGQHLETLLANELPLEAKSEVSVFNWLKGKYNYPIVAR